MDWRSLLWSLDDPCVRPRSGAERTRWMHVFPDSPRHDTVFESWFLRQHCDVLDSPRTMLFGVALERHIVRRVDPALTSYTLQVSS
jgi:hypothetical protein